MCTANNQSAVNRLYRLKFRDNKPGTVIASSIDQLVELGIKRRYLTAVERYWPSSISIVIPCGNELEYLHMGKGSLAIRIPEDKTLNTLINNTGPLLTSSANMPGETPANNILEAQEYFGEKIDFYVEGGDLSNRLPSTVIRVVDDAIEVLREGAVKIDESGRTTS